MVISKTPLRISFFGGGTDYPIWYEKYGGAVLSTSINKYSYLTCREIPHFFDFRIRVAWSKMELVQRVDEIEHPSVRNILKHMGINDGVEIHYNSDLPARSGLGSSSAFTVGLLNALHNLQGRSPDRHELARAAIHIERDVMNENVGSQDQVATAIGGLNFIEFAKDHSFRIAPVELSEELKKNFQNHLLLFFTGLSRTASDIAASQIKNTPNKENELKAMRQMVDLGLAALKNECLEEFGRLLHESWLLKKSLTSLISNSYIDECYEAGRDAGAMGGKLLGAGGGGFILMFADPSCHKSIINKLHGLVHVPFGLESDGTRVIYRSDEVANKQRI